MSSPPTVLILGGLAGDSTRLLLAHLLPPPSASDSTNSGCSFLRIVDKYLLMPGNDIYNTYIDSGAREALKRGLASGILEYNQGNLLSDGESFFAPHVSYEREVLIWMVSDSDEGEGVQITREIREQRIRLRL